MDLNCDNFNFRIACTATKELYLNLFHLGSICAGRVTLGMLLFINIGRMNEIVSCLPIPRDNGDNARYDVSSAVRLEV